MKDVKIVAKRSECKKFASYIIDDLGNGDVVLKLFGKALKQINFDYIELSQYEKDEWFSRNFRWNSYAFK